ncbi:hypothetical protein NBRC10512_007061 [Rhodotorula toruloides]|uniref:Uncharacterized protein n=1 Tax=Rhodotorula toruloides (strain NP11) TaxID=1130832 RepID=M7XL48_RHOT1|nr:uncharacterized protein RHTO_02298 [Rhodotorula toruloides NP11]EMS20888.1 hypothetical protein RHTO_02298 [Rhodotorula toruloides NP11]
MGSPITLKSWFASVEPGAPPGDRSLAVWIFGLRGEEEEPVALQLMERLGKNSFRTELDGERRTVKLEGPLATDRAKTAGVDEMYINTFRDGITEHLEFTLHAALALPPHKVRLSVAFPRSLRSSPSKKHSSPKKPPAVPDEPLPDSLFDLGTGYQSPARARRTRKELAEELHAARQRRDPFAVLRRDATTTSSTFARQDRDEGVASDDEEEADMDEVEEEKDAKTEMLLEAPTFGVADAPAQSAPPSEASPPRAEPAAGPTQPSSGPPFDNSTIPPTPALTDEAPPASSGPQSAKTPLRARPSSKKARLASLTASFFKSRPTTPSSSTSVAGPSKAVASNPASTSTIAAVLSTFFQKQPPSSPPPSSKPTATKSPARTPVKRVVALADCLASSSPALVSRLERAAGDAGTAGPERDRTDETKAEEKKEEVIAEGVEMDIEQSAAEPSVVETAENGAASAAAAQQSAATAVDVTAPTETQEIRAGDVVEKQEEKAEPMVVDEGAALTPPAQIAATPPPSAGPPRQPTASPFAHLHSRTASPRRSPFLASPRAAAVAPSERYSSIEPAFPSSQGGISSLFHDSADEGDGDDDSADLTAQQISEFVERDLASSVVDEDEYKRERPPKSSVAARPPKELANAPLVKAAPPATEPFAVDQDQQMEPTQAPVPTASAETVPAAAPPRENAPPPLVDSVAAPAEPEPAFEASPSTSTATPPSAAAELIAPPQHSDQPALIAQDEQLAEPPAEPPVQLDGASSVPSPELASYDAAKASIEAAAQEATEHVVGRAVGSAVEPVAGPVISDALAEIAARASGEVITGVVGSIVDVAVEAVVQAVQADNEEEAANVQSDEEKQDEPARSHSDAMGSQEPQDQQESQEQPAAGAPMADVFVEQDFLEPEQSKGHEGGAEFAAEYWAQLQAGELAAERDAEAEDKLMHAEEPSKKPLSDASARSLTSPNGSILSRDAAAIASDPVALAALSALRNEPEPRDSPNGSATPGQTTAGLSRESSHDVFGPVDHVKKHPSSSTPSQGSRPPRARTLSARQQAAPAEEPASRPPGKKAPRRDSTFIGVEILVSPRKRPAHARNSTAPPAASTSRAGLAKEVAHSPVEPNIFDSPAAPSPPPPAGSKSWLDAPAEARLSQRLGQQGVDGDSQDDLDDESDDPLAEPIVGEKPQNTSQRSPARRSIARAKVANGPESSSDASSDDEAVAKRLLNGTSTMGHADARAAFENEPERGQDDGKVRQRSVEESIPQRKKRAGDATPPPKAKRRRVSSSASQAAPSTSEHVPRRPSLAGKVRQPSASQPAPTARGTPARVNSASAARRKSRSTIDTSTPGSSARPARSRKPVDGWWDISRGAEAATVSAKKRGRNEMEMAEVDKNDELEKEDKAVKRQRKRRAIESSPELGADVETQERHAEREKSVAREDDGYDNSRDDDFDPSAHGEVEDDKSVASPKPAKKPPVPKTTPADGANGGKKKRRKRKSLVMPTFRNRKRQSAAATASASASPAPSHTPDPRSSLAGKGKKVAQEEREQGLVRASSVKKARKESASREEVQESSNGRAKPTQAKGRSAQPKKAKKNAVEMPDWAEGDEWAGLREVGIAREADEDPFHFSD